MNSFDHGSQKEAKKNAIDSSGAEVAPTSGTFGSGHSGSTQRPSTKIPSRSDIFFRVDTLYVSGFIMPHYETLV